MEADKAKNYQLKSWRCKQEQPEEAPESGLCGDSEAGKQNLGHTASLETSDTRMLAAL